MPVQVQTPKRETIDFYLNLAAAIAFERHRRLRKLPRVASKHTTNGRRAPHLTV